jgi:hypothetical protein
LFSSPEAHASGLLAFLRRSSRHAMKRLLLTAGLLLGALGLALVAPAQEGPPVVSLAGPNLTLRKALADIQKQTGIVVQDRRGEDVALPADWRLVETPFWQALDRLAETTSSDVFIHGPDGTIALVKRTAKGQRAPVSYSGPFRVALKRLVLSQDFDAGGATATATVEVAWGPPLRPLLLETRPQGLRLVAPDGEHRPERDAGSSLSPVDGLGALVFDVPLPAVRRAWLSLPRIEGKLTAIAPSKWAELSFGPLDRLGRPDRWYRPRASRTARADGIGAHIKEAKLLNDRWTVGLRVDAPPGAERFDTAQSWWASNVLELVSRDGKERMPVSSYYRVNSTARWADLEYHFTDKARLAKTKPADWLVVYRVPASLVEMSLPFVFRDVSLP